MAKPVQIPTGWQCPICGTVHAPHINTCPGHARSRDFAEQLAETSWKQKLAEYAKQRDEERAQKQKDGSLYQGPYFSFESYIGLQQCVRGVRAARENVTLAERVQVPPITPSVAGKPTGQGSRPIPCQ